jgi:transposase InsO family protein
MNVHKTARLTPAGRVLLVERIESGWPVGEAAAAGGVSVRTAYEWLRRYRSGDRQLNDRSSAPQSCPHQLTAGQVGAVEQLRRERQTGTAIARALGLARSTVGLVLRRLGLNRLAVLEPKPPVIRYERERPGELVHLDIKKLGKIRGIGHRFAPRGPGMHANKGHGWDFLHVAVDDASRLAYTETLPSEGQGDTTAFLQRALSWFGRLGVTPERVMTDKGSAYRSRLFGEALKHAGARHIRTRPYTPRTNGKAERFIQSCLREWAYLRPYQSSIQRAHAAANRTNPYNTIRPHSALAAASRQPRN